MLLNYVSLSSHPRIFRKLVGLSIDEFNIILEKLSLSLKNAFSSKGRPRKLKQDADKLLLLFMYYRSYATHEFLGYFVGLDNSNVCRLFRVLEPLVASKIHIEKDRTLTEDKILDILLDVTEQPIQRPKNKQAKKQYYSGKKKRHTQKFEIAMTTEGKIINVSTTEPGHRHDLRIRQRGSPMPPGATKYGDLGYQGWQNMANKVKLPHKKPKRGKITAEQKAENRNHSKIRIYVEHKFAQFKKFRILSETYRNFRRKHNMRVNIIAGVLNLQAGC